MDFVINIQLLVAVLAAAAGGVLPMVREFARIIAKGPSTRKKIEASPFLTTLFKNLGVRSAPVSDVASLFEQLSESSEQMDRILSALGKLAIERQKSIVELEQELAQLASKEEELRGKVQSLENVPLPAAEYFASLIEKREKKSVARDYMLFLAGVIVSVLASILLKHYGLA